VSLREPRRNLQIQSTAPLNVSGSHFRTRRAKPQRPLCPDETCMEVTALKDQAETCRHFADRTIAERGVRYGRVATTPTSAKTKRHPKAYLAIETPVVACPLRVKLGHPGDVRCTTALPPEADVHARSCYVAFVPISDICSTANCDYSITSSARASSVGGTSRPSALAVFKLMTKSNFVASTTGKSAGLAPLRIRPA